jgi:putative phage-type endonuclease
MTPQRTPAWRAARLGKVTASRIGDVITRTKVGYGAARATYAAQLVAERLTGVASEGFVSAAMQWGVETEAHARARYAFEHDLEVRQVGFLDHPTMAFCGASPDGLVGEDGLVEFKCPTTATHLQTLLGEPPPVKHLAQVQWQMAVTGRGWCDLVSYDPRAPFELQLLTRRIHRDAALISGLEAEVVGFLGEVEATLDRLRGVRAMGIAA